MDCSIIDIPFVSVLPTNLQQVISHHSAYSGRSVHSFRFLDRTRFAQFSQPADSKFLQSAFMDGIGYDGIVRPTGNHPIHRVVDHWKLC